MFGLQDDRLDGSTGRREANKFYNCHFIFRVVRCIHELTKVPLDSSTLIFFLVLSLWGIDNSYPAKGFA
jgi:hypothetical protein